MSIWMVMVGGGLGAICRYLVGIMIMKIVTNPPFPVAMLFVNILGSLGLGIFLGSHFSEISTDYESTFSLFLGIGFLGAFTTFSTFSVETMILIRDHQYTKAILYVVYSIVGSIIFFLVGFKVFLLD